MSLPELQKTANYIRTCILRETNQAGSGHPTSSLSATELMTALMFGGVFRYDPANPEDPNNDRLIFSKGHASPLLYALWTAAGEVSEDELLTYRQLDSDLEGHPVVSFPFAEAATGSLGQGLSIGFGMALNGKYLDKLAYRTYVLLGDSEMAEGSQWEAIQLSAHYGLNRLIGILDVNRLGQRGETMYGHDLEAYAKRVGAFGWETILVEDGHDLSEILDAYERALAVTDRPTMIIARTIKGKGVPSAEDKNGYHGKSLGEEAVQELHEQQELTDKPTAARIAKPEELPPEQLKPESIGEINYNVGDNAATRDAYGTGLIRIAPLFPELVALDGEVCNSTRAAKFRDAYPDRFFEMFVAEQNMVGAAIGLSRRGKLPFVSTFASFLTRAFDQIRMSRYSETNIKFIGSHAGTSIGQDGPSQMGLEDIAMFRTLLDSVVLYPSDAVATEKLVEQAARHVGNTYIRLTRSKTPVIYEPDEEFPIGGSKTLRSSPNDLASIVTAGYTLFEALAAYDELFGEDIPVRVIDLYSIKPLDTAALAQAAHETGRLLVVEDHYAEGGMGEAVFSALGGQAVHAAHLAVNKRPGSGPSDEVLHEQGLTRDDIAACVREMVTGHREDPGAE